MNDTSEINSSAVFWRRLAAIIYDSIVIAAIWMVVGFIVLSAFGIEQAQIVENDAVVMDPWYRFTLFGSMLLSAYLFFAWFWTHSGQTLGMQAWKIRVQNTDGSAISYWQALQRCVLAPFSFLLLGAGYFYMFFNTDKNTLHDRLSASVVTAVDWESKALTEKP